MKVSRKVLTSLVILASVTAGSAQTWNAATEFSISSNPSGVWGYGEIVNDAFAPCTSSFSGSIFRGWNNSIGQACLMQNVAAVSSFGIQPGHLSMECDYSAPILRFTAPFSSFFDIFLQVGGTTDYQNGGFGNAWAGYSSLQINGVDIAEDNFVGNVKTWTKSGVSLNAGDTVQAVLSRHYGGGNTDTMMTLTAVPEPASLVGFLAFAPLVFRRRRP